MIGILTEKPSAGRNFAKALGGVKGTYNGESYVIVSARGHLYEFVEPSEQVAKPLQAQYKSWDLTNLPWNEQDFQWKREKKKDTASTIKQIKDTLKTCDEICIATDVDPSGEGQLLAWEIIDEVSIRAKKYTRMYFTDESAKELQKAFVSRKVLPPMIQDPDYIKAYMRSRWDFLSQQFTRVATKCGDGRAVLRQGRLKSAMVKITGDGLKALADYKPVPFYMNKFRDENGVVYTNKDEPTFPDKNQVPKTYLSSSVTPDGKQMKATPPPKFYDLAALSARLSSKGIKAKQVLDTYQKMYEAQIVSYPRTEDKVITPEQFNELLPKIDAIAHVVGVDVTKLTHRTPRKTHVKTGGAHGANRPGLNVPRDLASLKQYGTCAPEIYKMLALNYLATLAEDYVYEAQKGHVTKYPKFVGTASVPKTMGWKAIFNDDTDPAEDENAKGIGTMASPFVAEGVNKRPPTPTMKWLMGQLEKHDVGTGATRTSIYADVTNDKAKYPLLKETKGKLSMTEYGDMSYQLLPGTHIGDLKITEQLMQDMRDVADGKLNPEVCLHAMQQMVRDDMVVMEQNGQKMRKAVGITMATTQQAERYAGTWKGKPVSFKREFRGRRLTDAECDVLLNGGEIEISGLKAKSGSTYGVIVRLNNLEYNGHKYVGIEQIGFANNDKGVPDKWCEHKFTDDEKTLLEAGKAVELTGCVSKKGNTFDCTVTWEEDDNGRMKITPHFN